MTIRKHILILVISAFSCISCNKDDAKAPLKEEDLMNIAYGANPRQVMDVFLPENRTSATPFIILVHGGSWFEGDKSSLRDLARQLRMRGYATASINYRLTNTPEKNIHPAQVNDIRDAINFISLKSDAWDVSPGNYGLLGASAGAHLALLYAYAYDSSAKIKTVVSLAGPTDLTIIGDAGAEQSEVVRWLIGSTYQQNPEAYQQASPMTHVKSTSAPTLIFHGKLDNVVPFQQSVALSEKLKQVGASSKLVLYDDTGHEVVNFSNVGGFTTELEAWFRTRLQQ